MDAFTKITSRMVPLPGDHIDTDQIIPARFLKAITRDGFGENLFYDKRFDSSGNPRPGFVLNDPRYQGQILISGMNFGCGSSREHAAWALHDYGFKAIVAPGFADIFRNNALNNGLLPVELPAALVTQLMDTAIANPELKLTIDLEKEELILKPSVNNAEIRAAFRINPYKRQCLLKGFDDIDYLLSLRNQILAYEQKSLYQQINTPRHEKENSSSSW
jgi:3-isopropylmalate/(R)-2-methylmalate dehydratase small subunit